jgi:transcriptional regulator with XRE-family HTH domain
LNTVEADRIEEWVEENPIRQWRKRTGRRQIDVAEETGTAVSQVAAWERATYFPSFSKLRDIAGLMGRDPAKLEHAFRLWYERRPKKGSTDGE